MIYTNTEWTIQFLLCTMKEGMMRLTPSYQRNFIWTKTDQRLLIDSIIADFPMPNFFIRKMPDGTFEMVDGKQRATTIYKYYNGEITDSSKLLFCNSNKEQFLEYRLNIVEIIEEDDSKIQEFFYRVNKRGERLNQSEINHAYHNSSDFKSIVNQVVDDQRFINLNLFTDKAISRMNDDSLVDELVAYLLSGFTEKRLGITKLLSSTIPDEQKEKVLHDIGKVLDIYTLLNNHVPINTTRYRQRNDFYTLFTFIYQHLTENPETLIRQYDSLIFLSSNKEYISPSNMDCLSLREYALNCVSQSNSSNARRERLNFFNEYLCCNDPNGNFTLNDIRAYLKSKLKVEVSLKSVGDYYIIDTANLV